MPRNGFTLIELLIVVVIIGILAAIAIPKFSNTKERSLLTLSGANTGTGTGGVSWTLAISNPGVSDPTTDVCHISGHSGGSTDEGVPICD